MSREEERLIVSLLERKRFSEAPGRHFYITMAACLPSLASLENGQVSMTAFDCQPPVLRRDPAAIE